MSLALNRDPIANPVLDRLAAEINRRFFTSEANYDGDRLNLIEQVLDFAASAEQQLVIQNQRISELEALTRTDDLTNLLNRRGLEADLARLFGDADRQGVTGVICYIDIDDFKSINDKHGHEAGDEALRMVAAALADNTRVNDLAARVGGDEFVVVLTGITIRNGLMKARRLQKALNEIRVPQGPDGVPLSVSLGIQAYNGRTDLQEVLRCADRAMYADKRTRKSDIVPIAV